MLKFTEDDAGTNLTYRDRSLEMPLFLVTPLTRGSCCTKRRTPRDMQLVPFTIINQENLGLGGSSREQHGVLEEADCLGPT